MDVSIAVSLIRGQMGAVVERAVNGAVETVLAEMLKVVGVKFEELKAQVATLKKDMTALQKEKALKEKENDKIRAMLRYTELKLKYYRQGVEEEMQQIRIQPNTHQTPRGNPTVSPTEAALSSGSVQAKTALDGALARTSQGTSSSQGRSRPVVSVSYQSPDGCVASGSSPLVGCELSDLILSPPMDLEGLAALPGVSVTHSRQAEGMENIPEGLSCPADRGTATHSKEEEEEDDCEWTISLQPHTETVDTAPGPSSAPGPSAALGPQSPDRSIQADSSTLPSRTPPTQVKQEDSQEEEVICIKEEPEEQEVMATLLLDCEVMQGHLLGSEGQRSPTEWSGLLAGQRHLPEHMAALSSAGPSSYTVPQPAAAMPANVPPRQAVRTWPKDLSLYEEYKLRRNELRRRSINRRREMEKSLPQPLLADLVRERREKTRLRVARWRAKRKLQACLNQAQAQGGAAGLSQQHGGNTITQHQLQQQLRASGALTSSSQQRQRAALPQYNSFLNNNNMLTTSGFPSTLPFIPPPTSSSSSSSSSSSHLGGHSIAEHSHHTVTSSSSHPQVSLSQQSISLMDTDVFQ